MTETTRQIVERMVRENPRISAAAIAETAGVTRERVRALLEDMGYRLNSEWRQTPQDTP